MIAGNGDPRDRKRPGRTVQKPALGKPKVYLCRHALERMKQRGIGEAEVFQALINPDETNLPTPNFRNRKHNSWKRSAKTSIHVIFEVLDDNVRVITAYDLRIDEASGEPSKSQPRRKARQRRPGGRGKRK